MKKKISLILAVVCVCALVVGSFAYFTDRYEASADAKTASIKDIIQVTPDPDDKDPDKNPDDKLEHVWEENNKDDKDPFVEPGDDKDLSFDLVNIGKGAIDVKETFILTSSVPLSSSDLENGLLEFRLYSATSPDTYGAAVGQGKIAVEEISADRTQVKYSIPAFTLAPNANKAQTYKLVFDRAAGNKFQGATCKVEFLCEMRQTTDGLAVDKGWDNIQTSPTTMKWGGEFVMAVPAK